MTKKTSSSTADYRAQQTLDEIADMMDVTRERIRQIEAKTLRKIRQRLVSKDIRTIY